jgi:hypothetical protein
MSAISCTCESGVNGFGFIDCFGKPSRVVGLGFQSLKSGSADNYLQAPVSQSVWEGSLWNKTASLRISVLNNVKEYTSERADAVTETIDEIALYLKDGQKMISFTVLGAPYKLKEYVDGLRCGNYGFYGIGEGNQLLGRRRVSFDEMGLIPIQKGTITSKIVDATNTTFSKMMVTFMIDERYDDSEFVYMPPSEITADLEFTNAMIQANAAAAVVDATSIQINLTWAASGLVSVASVEALENFDTASFFDLYNNTTSSAVTISSILETNPGIYLLGFSAQTALDDLTLSAGALAPFNFADITGLVAA